ncbi:GNAT family N-acetyltransferase [Sphingomonas sp. S1-29]|uniref:GNAT family N-acetyltransferase n=1 Tax=Sphingomonas sp. S1-29 TaxID=2991074 RepID=UPI00223FBFB5|nr:GNAT family N-acetyltransferase [Sphingomonas sp. S1-29]UZK68349.1 GNAT family N-acetyltransferase [Sphingomonas sp. S1-29]
MRVAQGELKHPAVVALLQQHFDSMLAHSPRGACHFLDLSGLAAPEATFLTAWEGETLLGCGALKAIDAGHGEVKSMRTADQALRRGVAATLLTAIVEAARAQGMTRLSLETGSGEPFAAAVALYLRHGFDWCEPFGDYEATPFNRFMTRAI